MKVKSLFQLSTMNCKVCGVETSRKIRCAALVCEACKRFFIRHRAMNCTLRCEKGDNQCLAGDQTPGSTLRMSEKGIVWRNICAACRFEKCISIGMNGTPILKEDKFSNGTASPPPPPPPQPSTFAATAAAAVAATTPTSTDSCVLQAVETLRQEAMAQMKFSTEIQQLQSQLELIAFILATTQQK